MRCHAKLGPLLLLMLLAGLLGHAEEEEETAFERQRNEALRAARERFPVVTANTTPGDARYLALDLAPSRTVVGEHTYHAFRFRAPAEGGTLSWSFLLDLRLQEWYILGVEDPAMQGFEFFISERLRSPIPGLAPVGQMVVLQTLPQTSLKPGQEYVIWFRFRPKADPTITYLLNILPPAGDGTEHLEQALFPQYWRAQQGDPLLKAVPPALF